MTITYYTGTTSMEMLDYHWLKLNVGTRRGGSWWESLNEEFILDMTCKIAK